jgi:oligopeptide/dipeptide ABC transporter ATP-binding protein
LDVSIQGQIVNLLVDLQREFGLAMLFISHNLAVVRHLSHRVLVIYRGRLVEVADRDALFAAPAHPYTRALLAAVPDPTGPPLGRGVAAGRALGDDPVAAPWGAAGCAFHDRCSYAKDSCLLAVPPLEEVASQHFAACHRWREVVYS